MRKLKFIIPSLIMMISLTSCETESIDEKLRDDTIVGKTIFQFELNANQKIITDNVTTSFEGNKFSIKAKLSISNLEDLEMQNNLKKYLAGYLTISYSAFEIGNYPAKLSIDNPNNYKSTAVFDIQMINNEAEREWIQYSTENAAENEESGFSNILRVNNQAKYIDGNFDYILYPKKGTGGIPQRISNGRFDYMNFK